MRVGSWGLQRKRECTGMQAISGDVNAGKRLTTCMDLLLAHGQIGRDSIGGNSVNSRNEEIVCLCTILYRSI
jgi:hypothetical protein